MGDINQNDGTELCVVCYSKSTVDKYDVDLLQVDMELKWVEKGRGGEAEWC